MVFLALFLSSFRFVASWRTSTMAFDINLVLAALTVGFLVGTVIVLGL
jgi:hypothetical protein